MDTNVDFQCFKHYTWSTSVFETLKRNLREPTTFVRPFCMKIEFFFTFLRLQTTLFVRKTNLSTATCDPRPSIALRKRKGKEEIVKSKEPLKPQKAGEEREIVPPQVLLVDEIHTCTLTAVRVSITV